MRFQNRELHTVKRGDPFNTVKLIDRIASQEKNHPFIQEAIKTENLNGSKESLKRVLNCIYHLCKFFPDPDKTQYIRSVNRMLKDRRANCVDYTVFLSSFLRALFVSHFIRIVQTSKDYDGYNHIYVVLLDGTAIDPVINQDQDGNEFLKEVREKPSFGEEVPYIKKFDKKIIA